MADRLAADTASPHLFGIRQSEYLKLNKPKDKALLQGETIPVSLTIAPVAEDYIACTAIVVLNEKTGRYGLAKGAVLGRPDL